jgi:ribonuclease-3
VYLAGGLSAVLGLVDRFLGEAFARATAGTLDRDYKTQLQELAQSKLRATPRYRVVAEHGPDHSKTFEVETDLRGEVVGRGAGRSKKDAEQAAAKLALDALGRKVAAEEGEGQPLSPAPAPPRAPAPAPAPAPAAEAPEPPAPPLREQPPAPPAPAKGAARRRKPAARKPAAKRKKAAPGARKARAGRAKR